jgi:hypothetical protein
MAQFGVDGNMDVAAKVRFINIEVRAALLAAQALPCRGCRSIGN